MNYFKLAFITLTFLWPTFLVAQNINSGQQAIEDLVEEIAHGLESEADYSQITDDLYYYLENPLNLNQASVEDLEKLRVLNDFQIKSLLNYLDKNGEMVSIYELQLIEGYDYTCIKKLLPFVTLTAQNQTKEWNTKKALEYGNHTVFGRVSSILESQQGYVNLPDTIKNASPNNYYPGNSLRIYTRYKFAYKDKLQWGVTAEKDPGEQFFQGNQSQGFDFYSAHLQVNNMGFVKTAVLGDYQAQFGQGLIMWSYLSTGKSSYVMDVRKRGKGLHRYSSTDENAYLRGGGVTLEKWGIQLTTFASYKNIDASVQRADSLNESGFFTAFQNLGIHATPSEIQDHKALQETLIGGNMNWQHKNFKIGVSGISYKYNIPFQTNDAPENIYRFRGSSNSNFSTDAEFRFKDLHLFTEAALSENGAKAILAGALMELSSQLRASILYRNYGKAYQAMYSNAFAEGSRVQNEQGFYVGIDMSPVKKWKLAGYYDFYKFPWLTSTADAPSKGTDYLIQADFVASRTVSMYWRYKHENKEANIDLPESGISKLGETQKTYFRYQIGYVPLENWEFRNRLELSSFNKEASAKEYGYMLYQDVIYHTQKYPLSIVLRYAIFDTESYNTRIYTYESDVLNAYSVPPLYDQGTRFYIMANYQLFESLDLWLRYSNTWYANKTNIGTGLNQINGDTKSEVKFQLRWKF